MDRTRAKVLFADFILALVAILVIRDIDWRVAYASSPHISTSTGYSASFAYSLLTQVFTMTGDGVTLSSPPTFDWLQTVVLMLVAVNAWYAFHVLRPGKSLSKSTQP